MTDTDVKKNIEALNKLRALPRGTHVESRIAAIQDLLGEPEIFHTLKNLRWPLGVVCPTCHSHNVILMDSPKDAPDQRQYYECLDCKKRGSEGGFDDLTGMDVSDAIHDIRQWILCWYLIGFCSVSQIAHVLGLSLHDVIQLAEQGAQLTETNKHQLKDLNQQYKKSKDKARQNKKEDIALDEKRTHSESLGRYKPGFKSSK